MILVRVALFFYDLVTSTLRTLNASLRGADACTTGWARLYLGPQPAWKVWWYGHLATVSPATIVIFRSHDDHWLYIHTLFGCPEELRSFEATMRRILALPPEPSSYEVLAEQGAWTPSSAPDEDRVAREVQP